MNSIYAIICLSDTVGSGGRVGAPGFRAPHDYHWLEPLRVYHVDGRIFNLAIHSERIEFNQISENAFRAAHKWNFPVPRILTGAEANMLGLPSTVEMPVMESGFDDPAPAGTPVPPPAPEEPDVVRSPEMMSSPPARREAQKLGIDLATVKGTGIGGIITKDDVVRTWRASTIADEPDPNTHPGQVTMAELMGAN